MRTTSLKMFCMFNFLLSIFQTSGQTPGDSSSSKNRQVIWFVPSEATNISGMSLGLVNMPGYHKQTLNGISIELLGYGVLTPFIFLDDHHYTVKARSYLKHNGLLIGPTLLSECVNGASISAMI